MWAIRKHEKQAGLMPFEQIRKVSRFFFNNFGHINGEKPLQATEIISIWEQGAYV